jgi:hypothetical protein
MSTSQLRVAETEVHECTTVPDFTFDDMRRALVKGWGETGLHIACTWDEFNQDYFGGELQPIPIFLTQTSPYGHWLGLTCCQNPVTHIALCRPGDGTKLVADCGVLLHEMIHQLLSQRRVCPAHAGAPWRSEIMRLHQKVTGEPLVLVRQRVIKVKQADGSRRSARVSPPGAVTQGKIARWPHSFGLRFSPL